MRIVSVVLLVLLVPACGDAPRAPRADAPPAPRLGDRIAASMADALQARLEAQADARMLAALEAPDAVVLLALHPSAAEDLADSEDEEERALAKQPHFHGHAVLGRKTLEDAAARERLVTLLAEGIARSGDDVADCFFPRHGVRLQGAGHTIDLVICYECLQMNVYGLDEAQGSANTSDVVEPRVSALYEAHGLTISDE